MATRRHSSTQGDWAGVFLALAFLGLLNWRPEWVASAAGHYFEVCQSIASSLVATMFH